MEKGNFPSIFCSSRASNRPREINSKTDRAVEWASKATRNFRFRAIEATNFLRFEAHLSRALFGGRF